MMETPLEQYADDHNGSVTYSEETVIEIEKEHLLASNSSESPAIQNRHLISRLCYTIVFLLLSNAVLLGFLVAHQENNGIKTQKSWLPPEIPRDEIFTHHTVYGDVPSDDVVDAWNALMPVGRGFVIIKNDTTLPEQPRLNQSIAEQHAMVSVFHQLHCLYMTRVGYYDALAGNIDQLNHVHMSHCWDYLRQAIMCFSDTSLEWVQAPPNNIGSTGWGFQHTCRDFGAVFSWAEENRLRSGTGIH